MLADDILRFAHVCIEVIELSHRSVFSDLSVFDIAVYGTDKSGRRWSGERVALRGLSTKPTAAASRNVHPLAFANRQVRSLEWRQKQMVAD